MNDEKGKRAKEDERTKKRKGRMRRERDDRRRNEDEVGKIDRQFRIGENH